MTLLAVENYIQSLLDGVTPPAIGKPIKAWVQPPPVVLTTSNPQAFVWGGRGDERRATLPRTKAQKRTLHEVTVTLMWSTKAGTEKGNYFPNLIDTVRGVLRAVNLLVSVVDPVTGETSQMTDLGERMLWDFPMPSSAAGSAGQQMLSFKATCTLPCYEWFVG